MVHALRMRTAAVSMQHHLSGVCVSERNELHQAPVSERCTPPLFWFNAAILATLHSLGVGVPSHLSTATQMNRAALPLVSLLTCPTYPGPLLQALTCLRLWPAWAPGSRAPRCRRGSVARPRTQSWRRVSCATWRTCSPRSLICTPCGPLRCHTLWQACSPACLSCSNTCVVGLVASCSRCWDGAAACDCAWSSSGCLQCMHGCLNPYEIVTHHRL